MSETTVVKGAQLGVVQTDVRDKSRKVVIEYRTKHPKYGKFVSKRTVLHCHDEDNASKNGDIVEIVQCRPVSKTKAWKISRIVEKRSN
jgi:small subunit ribosomal protein S17